MVLIDAGIVIFVNEEQPSKAFSPIDDTEGGISILVNDLQSSNAFGQILNTEVGISISFMIYNSKKHYVRSKLHLDKF